MKKRILSMILALLMTVCLLPVSAAADGAASGKCGDAVAWKLDANGTLTISGSGAMYDYSIDTDSESSHPWDAKTVKSVQIGAGVTAIGRGAFTNCEEMTAVVIPSSVVKIGEYAFAFCTKLAALSIPGSVTEIGAAAFMGIKSVKTLTIPGSVKTVGSSAFAYCSNVKSIVVNEGVESVGDDAFSGAYAAESVYLPKSLKSIGKDVFLNAKALGSVYFGGTQEQWSALNADNKAAVNAFSNVSYGCTLFADVSDPALYYYDPVMWAVSNGITNGMGGGKFMPDGACTRAQLVTFLWRLADGGAAHGSDNPFVDVNSDAYYYNAVMWAVGRGVTNGMDATHFAPDAEVTRGQVVTFLWRMAGSYVVKNETIDFEDVAEDAYYYNAVVWAVRCNITNGMSDYIFAPNSNCTRGQTMTFLFRDYAGK